MQPAVRSLSALLFLLFILPDVWFFPTCCRAAEKSDIPLPARVALSKAGALMNQKAYDRATEILTSFREAGGGPPTLGEPDPKGRGHAEIHFALGTCYLFLGDYRQASDEFEVAVRKKPSHTSAWLNLAKARYECTQYDEAARCFILAYENSENGRPEHLYFGAAAYLMAKQPQASIDLFERLMDRHPDAVLPEWRETFVHALLTTDRARRALPEIRILAETYTGEKQIQWQEILLHQYIQLEMREAALAYAQTLTRQSPTVAKWWEALAHVRLQDSNYRQALVALTVCGYLKPLSAREKKLLADLNLQLGIPIQAVRLYENALAEKSDARMLHNLMLALQQMGEPQKALAVLERFAPQSRDPDLLMAKADLLYGMKRFKDAQRIYHEIAIDDSEKASFTGRAWLMAGYAALQANDPDAGRRAFMHAADYKPHRRAALAAIKQIPNTRKRVGHSSL